MSSGYANDPIMVNYKLPSVRLGDRMMEIIFNGTRLHRVITCLFLKQHLMVNLSFRVTK